MLIDTPGLNDTEQQNTDVILTEIQRAISISPEGINCIILAFKKGRFTKFEEVVFDLLCTKIFEKHVINNMLICMTYCDPDLMENDQQTKWLMEEKSNNTNFFKYHQKCGGRMIFVSNPPYTGNDKLNQLYSEYKTLSRKLLIQSIQLFETRYQDKFTKAAKQMYLTEANITDQEFQLKMEEIIIRYNAKVYQRLLLEFKYLFIAMGIGIKDFVLSSYKSIKDCKLV